jgi:hypothetical protein
MTKDVNAMNKFVDDKNSADFFHVKVKGNPVWGCIGVSTYSPVARHAWARGITLRYEIVLLPGYEAPPSLPKDDIHSIWYEGVLKEPTAVWDHVSDTALAVVIVECFDPFCEMSDFIKIRDRQSGQFVEIDEDAAGWHLEERKLRKYPGDTISNERFVEHLSYYDSYDEKMTDSVYHKYFATNSSYHSPRIQGRRVVATNAFLAAEKAGGFNDLPRKAPGLMFGFEAYLKALESDVPWGEAERSIDLRAKSRGLSAEVVQGLKRKAGVPQASEPAPTATPNQKRASLMSRLFSKK